MAADISSHEHKCKVFLEELKRNGKDDTTVELKSDKANGFAADISSRGTRLDNELQKYLANDDGTEEINSDIKYLLENRDSFGNERLLEKLCVESCCEGRVDIVKLLLNHGVKPDCKNRWGRTALVGACGKGREEIVEILLKHGADVELYIDMGHTALMTAVLRGNEKIVATLIEYGANVNSQYIALNTALMMACKTLFEDIVVLLLKHGAKVNAVNYEKTTALMQSFLHVKDEMQGISKKCYDFTPKYVTTTTDRHGDENETTVVCDCNSCRHERIVEILIANGADVNAEDHFNRTAMIHAITHKNHKIVKMLFENGAAFESIYSIKEWTKGCKQKLITDQIFKLLLEYVPDLDAGNMHRETILMSLCKTGGLEDCVVLLLEKGVNVNAKDMNGKTALMHTCENGEYDCVELLLKYGADVNAQDTNGTSALMWGAMEDRSDCLEKLIDSGAKLGLMDEDGRTVFSCALGSRKGGKCLRLLLVEGFCLKNGRLKAVHRNAENAVICEEALLVAMEFGVFEWRWFEHSDKFSKNVGLATMNAGLCPGKVRYKTMMVSPLVQSFLQDDKRTTETFLNHFYYFPEDYITLCTDGAVRKEIKDWNLLEEFTHHPLNLQTWSFLTISKAISLTGQPGQRTRRIDSLPIPESLKRRLKFVFLPQFKIED